VLQLCDVGAKGSCEHSTAGAGEMFMVDFSAHFSAPLKDPYRDGEARGGNAFFYGCGHPVFLGFLVLLLRAFTLDEQDAL
jgi:hypothetical protein